MDSMTKRSETYQCGEIIIRIDFPYAPQITVQLQQIACVPYHWIIRRVDITQRGGL